jgi:hypothetical protein
MSSQLAAPLTYAKMKASINVVNGIESLGGAMSTADMPSMVIGGCFDSVTLLQTQEGVLEFRCFYLENTDDDKYLLNPALFFVQNSIANGERFAVGWDPADIDEDAQTIADENTPPLDVEFNEANTLEEASYLNAPVPPHGKKAFWIMRTIEIGASKQEFAYAILKLSCDNAEDLTNRPPKINNQQKVVRLCFVGNIGSNSHWRKVFDKIKRRKPDGLVILGNSSYGRGEMDDLKDDLEDWMPLYVTQDGTQVRKKGRDVTLLVAGSYDMYTDGDKISYSKLISNPSKYLNKTKINDIKEYFSLEHLYHVHNIYDVSIACLQEPIDVKPHEASFDDPQYVFFQQRLEEIYKKKTIKWRVSCSYRPIFSADLGTSYTGSNGSQAPSRNFNETFYPLLNGFGTTIHISGCTNLYQRSYPSQLDYTDAITGIPRLTELNPNYIMDAEDGQSFASETMINVSVGTGGKRLQDSEDFPNFMAKIVEDEYGYLVVDFDTPNKQLRGRFYDEDDNLKDSFMLINPKV